MLTFRLCQLYIGDYNVNANEFDFKKALDLTAFIDKVGAITQFLASSLLS